MFHDSMILRLGDALVHFVWQGTLIAGLLAIVLGVLRRRSPNVKYAVCWVALSGMAVCVPLTAWLIDEEPVIQTVTDRVSEAAESRTNVKSHSDVPDAARAAATAEGDRRQTARQAMAQLELLTTEGQSKSVTITLGQTASEIADLCKPARPYADDDPWLAYAATEGGSYLLLFTAEGTAERMRRTPDGRQDTLYAVVHYPSNSKSNGRFLLPETMRERICGDFVTLKVPVAPDRVRVSTVALGMNAADIMRLFQPALNHAEDNHAILLDAIDQDARYLLILSGQGDGATLSEVVYLSGEDAETLFMLPRSKREVRVPEEYRAMDQSSDATATVHGIAWGEPKNGLRLGLSPEIAHLSSDEKHFSVSIWIENCGNAPRQVPLGSWGNGQEND